MIHYSSVSMQCVYKKNVNLSDLYLRNPYCSKYKYFTAKDTDGRSTVYHDKGIDVQGRSTKTSNICEFIACTIICTWLIKGIEPDVNGITTD